MHTEMSPVEILSSLRRTVQKVACEDYQGLTPAEFFAYRVVGYYALTHESEAVLMPNWTAAIELSYRENPGKLRKDYEDFACRKVIDKKFRVADSRTVTSEEANKNILKIREIMRSIDLNVAITE